VEKKHDQDLPPTVKLPPPLPEPPLRLDIGFGYAAQGWHLERAPLHGPAGFVSLAKTTGPWRPGAWLSAEVRFPVTVRRDDNAVQMTLHQGAVRLLFTADRSLSSRWMARGGIGGGFDWININDVLLAESPSQAQLSPLGGTRVVPMLRALALLRYAFAAKSEIFFGLAGDLDVGRTRYVTETSPGETQKILLEPSWLRPMALIGITADVLAY
jgi:hypothetical protein